MTTNNFLELLQEHAARCDADISEALDRQAHIRSTARANEAKNLVELYLLDRAEAQSS